VSKDITDLAEFLERGVAEVIERPALEAMLRSGERLRAKQGFDPTRPNLHLGHVVNLRKLRQMARWGHEVVVIIGDYTALAGDPSERDDSRPLLSRDDVERNAETYLEQFHRIVPRENVRIARQSEWYESFSLRETIELASRFTAQQMLAREEFRNRIKASAPIPIKDMLYPLLQAQDSVAIRSDVEFGGTDQKFNILLGRELQEKVGQRPQQVYLVHLLPGLDGEKMSKTKPRTGIWLTDDPRAMFGKVMSLPDHLMPVYFESATELPLPDVRARVAALADSSLHPREAKESLARQIVAELHDPNAADEAASAFRKQFVEGRVPEDIHSVDVRSCHILDVLVEAGFAKSRAEARRLIDQRGVRVDGATVTDQAFALNSNGVAIIQVGPRKLARIRCRASAEGSR
jgi:tyrosyl-tRNA synthetase